MPQSVEVGAPAPSFTLPDTNNQSVSLESLRGRPVVLVFFPLAFSSVCTKEMCPFRDTMNDLNQLNAQVVGVSVDSPFSLKQFAQQNNIEYPLLSDFNKQAATTYGVLREDLLGLKGVANRSAFILDKDGIVRWKWVSEDPRVEPDYNEIQSQLRALSA